MDTIWAGLVGPSPMLLSAGGYTLDLVCLEMCDMSIIFGQSIKHGGSKRVADDEAADGGGEMRGEPLQHLVQPRKIAKPWPGLAFAYQPDLLAFPFALEEKIYFVIAPISVSDERALNRVNGDTELLLRESIHERHGPISNAIADGIGKPTNHLFRINKPQTLNPVPGLCSLLGLGKLGDDNLQLIEITFRDRLAEAFIQLCQNFGERPGSLLIKVLRQILVNLE